MRFFSFLLILSYIYENHHASIGNFNVIMANAFILRGLVMGEMIVEIKVMNQKQMVLFAVVK